MIPKLLGLALLAASTALAQSQQTKVTPGVTEKQIREMLLAGVNTGRIVQAVKERGIEFDASEETLKSLRSAGAEDALLDALRAATPSPLGMDEILELVAGKKDPQKIALLLQKHGISFAPIAEQLDTLRIAGATPALVEAVRTAKQASPPKDSPSSTNLPSPPELVLPKPQANTEGSDSKGVKGPVSGIPDDHGVYRIGGVVSPPKELYAPSPDYDEKARKAKVQGDVVLSIVIDALGNPTDIRVVKSLDKRLDQKAIEKVRTWKFIPGTRDGAPVPVRVKLQVRFRLF